MSTTIFFHVAILNNYQNIINELVDDIKESGLYDYVDDIQVGIVGGNVNSINKLPSKYRVVFESKHVRLYEKPTLTKLYNHCVESPGNVLYIHTKNARTVPTDRSRDYKAWKSWASREVHRKYMSNFIIRNYNRCVELLNNHDAVGCDFRNSPENTSHFAGNFWWANNSFIRTLPSWNEPMFPISGTMGRSPRHYCERWLLCYNNADNTYEPPNYHCEFWGAHLRKSNKDIEQLLSLTKPQLITRLNEYKQLQDVGKFPKKI